jgi:hypothetical protein
MAVRERVETVSRRRVRYDIEDSMPANVERAVEAMLSL